MKKLILFIIVAFSLLTGCSKSLIQIFDTATTNTKLSDGCYVFENDTVKITYSFWESQGVMSFSIFNKLNKPLYIDWKNCSYIANGLKFNYWMDETQTNQANYYGAYYYKGPLLQPGITVTEGVQIGSSSTVKPERITFIPPKSYSIRSQFYLLPVKWFKMSSNSRMTIEPRNDKQSRKTKVYTETFDPKNTPLRFRNFIAISLSETSQDFDFIDNEFYLTSVKEMDYRHYRGKCLGKDKHFNNRYGEPIYKKNTSFYIEDLKAKWYE